MTGGSQQREGIENDIETDTEIESETGTDTANGNDEEGSATQGGLSLEDGLERQRHEVQRALRVSRLGMLMSAWVVGAW